MAKRDLQGKLPKHSKIWYTNDLAVFRQLGFWFDVKECFQFVPTRQYGIVVVTAKDEVPMGSPLLAWVVFRPMSLSLAWDYQQQVKMQPMIPLVANDWYRAYNSEWSHIVAKTR